MINSILSELSAWARKVVKEIGSGGVFVFGSLIHRDGAQFDPDTGDVDLVVRFPTHIRNAEDRKIWLTKLHPLKIEIELKLATLLNRDQKKAICNFVVPTSFEIWCDVHKGPAVEFFSKNFFFDLLSEQINEGFSGAGKRPVTEPLVQQCLGFVQSARHRYLDVSANRNTSFVDFDGGEAGDVLPKPLMRHAAIVSSLSSDPDDAKARYDVQFGLDYITNELYRVRDQSDFLNGIHDRISRRRAARGPHAVISVDDQVYLSEWIFDALMGVLERRQFELYLQDPVPEVVRNQMLRKIGEELAESRWRLDEMAWGQGATDPYFNLEIVRNRPNIPLTIVSEKWLATDYHPEDLQTFALTKARQKPGDLFNDEKIRLASDFIDEPTDGAVVQRTDYFSSVTTDQIAWSQVRTRELDESGSVPKHIIWDGVSAFIEQANVQDRPRLKGLGETSVSNQVGGSTLAFSRDGHMMIVYQAKNNLQSDSKLAPSGSGSFDWRDVDQSGASDLLSLVRYGARRELHEECALGDGEDGERYIASSVMVLGFARMLHRGGKPEFYCLGMIDATAKEITQRKPERYVDRVITSGLGQVDWNSRRIPAEIQNLCRDYLDRPIRSENVIIPLSYPLEQALRIVIDVLEDTVAGVRIEEFVGKSLNEWQ